MEATIMLEDEAPPPDDNTELPPELIVTPTDEENARKAALTYANGIGVNGELMPPALCEDALALEFARQYAHDWRYVAAWGLWLYWDASSWKKLRTRKIFNLITGVCREVDARNPKRDGNKSGTKWKTVSAVEKFAQAHPFMDSSDDIWDKDPWMLATPRGMIDLKTGDIRPACREDYATKSTTAHPEGDCPRWRKFLDEITDGDVELQAYLARVAGYTLTGTTTEHAMFFLYGSGGNGKSTFVDIISLILGDYFTGLPLDALIETKNQQHTTDLAGLQGARMVSSSEIEKGRRWAKAKLSAITGGGPITARLMRQDNFTFQPQFKLLISGNNKPAINDVDDAIRRRMHLIPFAVNFKNRDQDLKEKLYLERDGILAWALSGCLEWQAEGLCPPTSVVEATKEYLESEDIFGKFLAEKCRLDRSVKIKTMELFQAWKTWAEAAGEYPGTVRRISQELDKRGFKIRHSMNGNYAFGLDIHEGSIQDDMMDS
jgi:putative DNA primase/helicase